MKISEAKVIENMLRAQPCFVPEEGPDYFKITERSMARLVLAIMHMCEDYEDETSNP